MGEPMSATYVRIALAPTSATYLPCISCGGFRTELVVLSSDGSPSESGLHKSCVEKIAAKFTRKKRGS